MPAAVLSFDEVREHRKNAALAGCRIVLTNGCFDLLHRGHVTYLEQSAQMGDILIVAVNSDASVRELKGPSRPLNHEQDRAFLIASLRCVDFAFIFRGPRLDAEIAALRPDVYTKAGDYTLETMDAGERSALLAAGTEIRFMPFVAGHSTTGMLDRMASPPQT